MVKMTKKDLKDLSISLGAYYCGGNVYTHENIAYYISTREFSKIVQYGNIKNDIARLLNNLDNLYNINELENGNKYSIVKNQIAYSCGYYGNTGQLVKYSVIARDTNDVIYNFYTYYC